MMDWQMAQFVVSAAMFLLGGAAGVYAWFHERQHRRRLSVDTEIGALHTRAHESEKRIEIVERDQNKAPTHQDLGKIYSEVNSLARSIATLEGQIGRMAESLSRVEQHLINRTHNQRTGDDR